ncbi:ATP-dependent RNA helicase ddx54 [Blyttiomyces sp. JEL0837]|nr:ATP-dependent RNA helicase ddx54 [Blyttiomyces sp. JEL0837]
MGINRSNNSKPGRGRGSSRGGGRGGTRGGISRGGSSGRGRGGSVGRGGRGSFNDSRGGNEKQVTNRGRGRGGSGRGGSNYPNRNHASDRQEDDQRSENKNQSKKKYGPKKGSGKKDEEDTEFETVPMEKQAEAEGEWITDPNIDDGDVGDDDGSEFDEDVDGMDDHQDDRDQIENGTTAENSNENDEDNDLDEGMDDDEENRAISKSITAANKKHKKSGGFQSMGLSYPIYNAIIQKGYKVPTPIQRKAIPIIMERRDIVAMARTGSGKTAAFIIPLLERLKSHSAKVGARALILAPSRELALQTNKFVKELGKHTDLRASLFVGGEQMDEQFAALANNPDIIIATPGRLMHLIIEAHLDLKTVEYVVFDEADRLFEMGFSEQLKEILFKLPESRQTLLFSATLPKLLVDFAKAGLSDPALIRLDVDTKISPDLEMMFLSLKMEDKDAALIYLLNTVIPQEQQTIVFGATKHVVEYLHEMLTAASIKSTYIYGSLDQVARQMHINQFRAGTVKILIVTDVAARGIDIPLLDNVINYDFPSSSKVLVHRVGRAGRAGRKGTAFSLLSSDEVPFLVDFQLFTGRPIIFGSVFTDANESTPNFTNDLIFGLFPPSVLDMDREHVSNWLHDNVTLQTLNQSAKNSYKMYHKTRGVASKESYTRSKEILESDIGIHPFLKSFITSGEIQRAAMLQDISKFRPQETVFEVGRRGLKSNEALLMGVRRKQLAGSIQSKKLRQTEDQQKALETQRASLKTSSGLMAEEDIQNSFKDVISTSNTKKRKREQTSSRDAEFYMSHYQKDAATERGYALNSATSASTGLTNNFAERASEITLDIAGDDDDGLRRKGNLVWDKRKHKFVRETVGADNKKRIKTESGASVPASFKSNRFEQWQKKTKLSLPRTGEEELSSSALTTGGLVYGQRKYRHNSITAANPNSANFKRKQARMEKEARKEGKPISEVREALKSNISTAKPQQKAKSELRSKAQIAKGRKIKEKRREKNARTKGSGRGGKGGGKGGRGGGKMGRGGKR